ncbi:MAG: aryl-sulfate sulfotransferase [Chitinophagales bacterium]
MKHCLLIAIWLIAITGNAQTIGLLQHEANSLDWGYVLFAPVTGNTTYLIDKCGRQVKGWSSAYKPGQSVSLLPDGTLLHTGISNNSTFLSGGKGGVIEKIDWNGAVLWQYNVSDATKCQHHDAKALPNGNVLVIAWESKTNTEAIAAGRNPALVPATLWSEQILELQPVGTNGANVVWEWHLWDHLVQDFDNTKANYDTVSKHPELVNLNFNSSATNSDWIHLNAIDYNPDLDQILISSHAFSEIWVIDHSTTAAEAATHSGGHSGKGGDLLYRWGNPQAYNNGAAANKKFFGQHNAHWIETGLPHAGAIMVFNNGLNRPGGNYSTVEILQPPVSGTGYSSALPYGPAATAILYNAGNPNNFYAQNISGAQQLSNGNVLICDGPAGTFFEIDSQQQPVWKYIDPVSISGVMAQNSSPSQNLVFRCTFYPETYSAFSGHNLAAGSIIEDVNPVSAACTLTTGVATEAISQIHIYPNPATARWSIELPENAAALKVYDVTGKLLWQQFQTRSTSIDASGWTQGFYFLTVKNAAGIITTYRLIKK